MADLGSWKVGDIVTFNLTTYSPQTGQAQAADTTPTYRVYKNIAATPLVTGNFTVLDAANVTGFYVAQITLGAGAGFAVTQGYTVVKIHTTGAITRVETDTFQMEGAVSANTVVDKAGYGLSAGERSTFIQAFLDFASAIESGATFKQTMRLLCSAVFGKGVRLSATNPGYTSTEVSGGVIVGATERITVTGADAFGNRPNVAVNVT